MYNPFATYNINISATEFEKVVCNYLKQLPNTTVTSIVHNEKLEASDGIYQIDITVRFRNLEVDFLVLIECKKHNYPIKREMVQALQAKVQSCRAHKGILFATNTFQKGALEYAKQHGIALVSIINGEPKFETRFLTTRDLYRNTDNKDFHLFLISQSETNTINVHNINSSIVPVVKFIFE